VLRRLTLSSARDPSDPRRHPKEPACDHPPFTDLNDYRKTPKAPVRTHDGVRKNISCYRCWSRHSGATWASTDSTIRAMVAARGLRVAGKIVGPRGRGARSAGLTAAQIREPQAGGNCARAPPADCPPSPSPQFANDSAGRREMLGARSRNRTCLLACAFEQATHHRHPPRTPRLP
jgi:hypothetical protein